MSFGKLLILGFLVGLFVHVVQGHGFDLVWRDALRGLTVTLLVPAAYFLWFAVWLQFFVNREVYERNRQATLLARKYNSGVQPSEAERIEITRLVTGGILEHRGIAFTLREPVKFISPLQLTNRALDALTG